ncbi:unnamed protein product [Peniophora sp. CBMAI 1063]|nr:unnamed protein product [Peniophora sp. CBMAI 1063]
MIAPLTNLTIATVTVDLTHVVYTWNLSTTFAPKSVEVLVGQRFDRYRSHEKNCLTTVVDKTLDEDVVISIKLVQEPDAAFPVAHITFMPSAGRQRVRVPPGFKIVLKEDASILVERVQLEGVIPPALADAQVHNANCYWIVPKREDGRAVRDAWLMYELVGNLGPGALLWPVFKQPTSIDRESLKDVITPWSVRHFLLNKALDDTRNPITVINHVEKRFRVEHARKRFSFGNIDRLMVMAGAPGERREDVEFGAKLVMAALNSGVVTDAVYEETLADAYAMGMLGV